MATSFRVDFSRNCCKFATDETITDDIKLLRRTRCCIDRFSAIMRRPDISKLFAIWCTEANLTNILDSASSPGLIYQAFLGSMYLKGGLYVVEETLKKHDHDYLILK